MLKRVCILTLCLLYFVTANGFALNTHYCLGKLKSVDINATVKACSAKKMSKKCCQDKRVDVKVKDAHKAGTQSLLTKIFQIDLPKLPFERYFMPEEEDLARQQPPYRGPPVPGTVAPYLKNCNLRL